MRKRVVAGVVLAIVTAGCSDDGDAGPGQGIDASWTLKVADQNVTCAEAYYEHIRITAVPTAGGDPISQDFPCTAGGRLLPVPGGQYTVSAEGIASALAFDRAPSQPITVPAGAAAFAPFILQVSEATGRLHATWSAACDGGGPDSVRLDVPDGAITSIPCIALQLTSSPIVLGAGTAHLRALRGSDVLHSTDLPYELTKRGQVFELPRVDFP